MPESDVGLRDRLVEVGAELLAREGVPALTLREIARQAGVSHGAPRRYFPTHQALLAAIASKGFEELRGLVMNALAASSDPRTQLQLLGREYLVFARLNPGMFELMFRHDLLRGNEIGLRQDSLPLFEVLVDLVTRARPRSAPPPRLVAGVVWANLHGLAQLYQWGSLGLATQTDDVDRLVRIAIDAHLALTQERKPA